MLKNIGIPLQPEWKDINKIPSIQLRQQKGHELGKGQCYRVKATLDPP